MHYNTSSTLIIVAIIILAIALIAAIIAYKKLRDNVASNNTASDISNIKGVLMFFIVVDSLMLLASFYALAKLRTSNVGGWVGLVFGLIISIIVLIVGISAINKIDDIAFPQVLRGLVINTVFIILAFFLLILSVFAKPKICTGSSIKKIYQNMRLKANECAPIMDCAPVKIDCPPIKTNCAPVVSCPPQGQQYSAQAQQYVQNPYLARQ